MTATSETDLKRQLTWHGDYKIDLDIHKKTNTYTKRPTHIKTDSHLCQVRQLQI